MRAVIAGLLGPALASVGSLQDLDTALVDTLAARDHPQPVRVIPGSRSVFVFEPEVLP